MNHTLIKPAFILPVILMMMASPCLAIEKVAFRHKTEHTLKTDCRKTQGRHNSFPTYFCYDTAGNLKPFDPGNQWEQVQITQICFQNKRHDNIRVCLKIRGPQDKTDSYACMRTKGVLTAFQPDKTKWKLIDASDHRCQPLLKKADVPRNATIIFTNNTQTSKNHE